MNRRSALKRLAERNPALAAAVKPVLVPVIVAGVAGSRAAIGWVTHLASAGGLAARRLWRATRSIAALPKDRIAAARMRRLQDAAKRRLVTASIQNGAPGIGKLAQGKLVLMLVVSDLRIDPRVEREARALVAGGYEVHVVCPDFTIGQDPHVRIDWGPGVTIRLVDWHALQYIMVRPGFMGFELFDAALAIAHETKPFAIHAHDLNTCLIGLAIAHNTGAHLIADFHEWTSENVHWDSKSASNEQYPEDWKSELQALEERVMREASAVITVCGSIAEAISRELGGGRALHVIRNIPALSAKPTRDYPPLKAQLDLPANQFVLLWQGGTGPTRLIEPIIQALEFAPRCVLVIRGPSLDIFGPDYRAIAEKAGAGDRLILCDPVPSRDVVAAARGADAGIWTLPRLCRNFTYALPNKIFEYTASNLALLVADYPEARRMVETHGVGLTFDPYDPHSIAAAINRLIDEPGLAESLRANTHVALQSLDAEGEWRKLVSLYDALPRRNPVEAQSG